MQFVRLTRVYDGSTVYFDPTIIGAMKASVDRDKQATTAIYHRNTYIVMDNVKESPAEILDLAAIVLDGEVTTFYPVDTGEPAAVDIAIDEAYERGHLDGGKAGYACGRRDALIGALDILKKAQADALIGAPVTLKKVQVAE